MQPDYDKELYKARHLIENFFAKLKLFRAIATRYDKTAYGSARQSSLARNGALPIHRTDHAREIDLLKTIYGECCAREVLFLPVR